MNFTKQSRITFYLALLVAPIFCSSAMLSEVNDKSLMVEDISVKIQKDKKTTKKNNEQDLRPFPDFKREEIESEVVLERDPFAPINYRGIRSNPTNMLNIKLIGLIDIKDKKAAFLESPKGLRTYYLGDQVSSDYKITELSVYPPYIIIDNGLVKKTIKLKAER